MKVAKVMVGEVVVAREEAVREVVVVTVAKVVVSGGQNLEVDPLRDVPDTDAAIFRVGNNQLLLRVENGAGDVVGVPPHRVHFPRLCLVHAPQLDLELVRVDTKSGDGDDSGGSDEPGGSGSGGSGVNIVVVEISGGNNIMAVKMPMGNDGDHR